MSSALYGTGCKTLLNGVAEYAVDQDRGYDHQHAARHQRSPRDAVLTLGNEVDQRDRDREP